MASKFFGSFFGNFSGKFLGRAHDKILRALLSRPACGERAGERGSRNLFCTFFGKAPLAGNSRGGVEGWSRGVME
jgi:hypothetical protein